MKAVVVVSWMEKNGFMVGLIVVYVSVSDCAVFILFTDVIIVPNKVIKKNLNLFFCQWE